MDKTLLCLGVILWVLLLQKKLIYLMKFIHFYFILICIGYNTKVQSQNTREFSISDLFNISKIAGATISPDGKNAAVIIERPRKDRFVYSFRSISFGKDIWLLNIESGSYNKIIDGAKDSCSYWNPVWSPDSRKLAVLSTSGEDNVRAFVYDIEKDQLDQVHENGVNLMTKTYQGASGYNDPYLWLDSVNLIVSLLPKDQSYNTFQMDYLPLKTITEEWQHAKYNVQNTASILDTDSLTIFPNDQNSQLVQYHLKDRSIQPLDSGYFRHMIISPSKQLLFVVKRNGGKNLGDIDRINSAWNFNHQAGYINLNSGKKYYVPLDDLNAVATAGNKPHFWSNNSRFVLIKDDIRKYQGCLDVYTKQFQPFDQAFTTVKRIGQSLYLKSQQGWFQFDESNGNLKHASKLPSPANKVEISIQGTEICRDDKHQAILSKQSDNNGLHLIFNNEKGANKLFTLNSWISEINPIKKEIIKFTDESGKEQNALLLLSSQTEIKGLVVECYPGRVIGPNRLKRDYRLSNDYLNPIILTSNGYHVLIPTIDTKSTDEFEEFNDFVLPAVESTIQKKQLDGDKVAIIGLSQGGYLVYSVISQTNRFSSAISLAGFGNAFSLYGIFDIRYRYTQNPFENIGRLRASERAGFGGFGQPAFVDPNKYLKNSPVLYTKAIETPLLIIQGDKDYVSIEQGEEMFTHLYRQGKKARFLRFWGEGHNIIAPKNIEKMWREILLWLDQTLK